MIQAASQFNCLEFPSPQTTPENGISGYEFDQTQGPACALACPSGTVFRNYFAPVRDGESEGGQTEDYQINNLDEFELAINNRERHYFTISNGYSFAGDCQKFTTSLILALKKVTPTIIAFSLI